MNFPFKSIHIAGTNGKGSTAEYTGNIIRAAGYSCGVYTSPHVVHPVERIKVNSENIPEVELERLLDKYSGDATFFHAYTDAAFEWFREKKVDYAVVETGLGGRLDPTNEITPKIGILTSIGFDHTDVLGHDIKDIAKEKCGIIKHGMQIVTCSQKNEVMQIIKDSCREKNCNLITVDDIQIKEQNLKRQTFDLNVQGKRYENLEIQMPGMHQPQNASLAAAASIALGLDENAIRIGLANTKVISRFEIVSGEPTIILDGAHNEDSALELKSTVEKYFKDRKVVLLTAVMADKDLETILKIFASFAGNAITVKADHIRGADPKILAQILKKNGVQAKSIVNMEIAYKEARLLAMQKNALLVVSGSFYLTGSIKKLVGN